MNGTGLVNGAGLGGGGGPYSIECDLLGRQDIYRVLSLRVFSLHMLFEDLGLDEISW